MPAPEDLRILLWDIDGTLLRSTRRDSFKDYTIPALERVFGTSGRLAEMRVSGMTDLQIIAEALRDEGFTPERVRERVGDLREHFVAELKRVLAVNGAGQSLFQLLPGVREALAAADAHPRYMSALLSGNLEPVAHLKLQLVGLDSFFRLPGAFGDDSHDRRDLPALAHERICSQLGFDLKPWQFFVIGDTPNDIACARHFGARAVAVGTGRYYARDELMRHAPEAFLPDMSDTAALFRVFDSL